MRISAKAICAVLAIVASAVSYPQAASDFYKEFKAYYDNLLSDLSVKPPAELAQISDFTYHKDLATFEFKKGKIYLLRKTLGRPTTAIFIGEGKATINVPVHTERQTLLCCSVDSLVRESFEVAFIRMADDFDLELRKRFTFEQTSLPWRDFNLGRKAQGEFFFRPVVMHLYDNLFELLRSAYERSADGYFWIDFNRYVYTYDPNRPEEVSVSYEKEGGDLVPTAGALLQRQEHGLTDDTALSHIPYPTTMLERTAYLRIKGQDGRVIDTAWCDVTMTIDEDSLKFVSLFLHYNLYVDSVLFEGKPVDYQRRRDFTFMGIILPRYLYRGDTLRMKLWYHGKDFGSPLPFVEDLTPSQVRLTFNVPKGYNFIMPAMSAQEDAGRGRQEFSVAPEEPYSNFIFQSYASGYDTVQVASGVGITLNFLKSSQINKRNYECFIPDDLYEQTVTGAFNYLAARLGAPPAVREVYIYPESSLTMPGLIEISQVECRKDNTGGLEMSAAKEIARQWFGALARPMSDREYWSLNGPPDYLSLMYVQQAVGADVFFGELARRRDYIITMLDKHDDLPLAAGKRVESNLRTARGTWLMHMLRFLMYDLDTGSDRTFLKFVRGLSQMINTQSFTNADIIRLAEKYYGQPLDWFFYQWLYHNDIPESHVTYSIRKKDNEFFIDARVKMSKVPTEFQMPVVMRVTFADGNSTYLRETIKGQASSFTIGPWQAEPKEMIFNELYSMLSRDKVDKQ